MPFMLPAFLAGHLKFPALGARQLVGSVEQRQPSRLGIQLNCRVCLFK
jgi:hypothetical protein